MISSGKIYLLNAFTERRFYLSLKLFYQDIVLILDRELRKHSRFESSYNMICVRNPLKRLKNIFFYFFSFFYLKKFLKLAYSNSIAVCHRRHWTFGKTFIIYSFRIWFAIKQNKFIFINNIFNREKYKRIFKKIFLFLIDFLL